jgi:hypothetical protein
MFYGGKPIHYCIPSTYNIQVTQVRMSGTVEVPLLVYVYVLHEHERTVMNIQVAF